MKSKYKVYEQLKNVCNNDRQYSKGITAKELESFLDVKRSVISHYLNILFTEGKVLKTNTRPVRYYLKEQTLIQKNVINKKDIFSSFIGSSGSLKTQVEQCKSAVVYPPYGLPIVINGNSGVGKSFLASLIYKYAVMKKVIKEDAPFVELNCADYANNPELLSSVLFGHVEGAFTGAVKDKKGFMDKADGGYLFLDEIHRLSNENQEKLFFYLDKHKFRRLGENEAMHSANVRLIFATTENIKTTMIETFYRRIPLKIKLTDFQQRPLIERIALIYNFYKNEAVILDKDIKVSYDVLNTLTFSVTKGNIGMLKNYIKLSCANAYKNQADNDDLIITNKDLVPELNINNNKVLLSKDYNYFYVYKNEKKCVEILKKVLNIEDINIENLINLIKNKDNNNFVDTIKLFIEKVRNKIFDMYNLDLNEVKKVEFDNQILRLMYYKLDCAIDDISKKYGVFFEDETKSDFFSILMYVEYKMYGDLVVEDINNVIQRVKNNNQKAFQLASKLIMSLKEYKDDKYKLLYLFFPIIISNILKNNTKIQAIIACHGDSTASSIASVANTLCATYIFEPFDMAITDDSRDIFQKVNKYIDNIDTSNGLILLVDMGSLQEMYEPIKNHLQGELLIINNVTTNIAVDIGIKISMGNTLQEIIEKSKDAIHTEVRYYEGIAKGDNIVISCISGMGIARKLKKIFENCIENNKIEIITIEYRKLKKLIQLEKASQFKRTKLIITTNKLDTSPIPSINIEDIVSDRQHKMLANYLSHVLSKSEIKKISDEIIKFFSIEGISSQLVFLNPNIVVNDVDNIIRQYEEYYNVCFESHLRLNLYMHISIMIERLMTSKVNESQDNKVFTKSVEEFVNVTQNIFDEIKEKYHIDLPLTEIMFIYEIMESQICKK